MAYVGEPHFWTQADRVQISVAFTWDIPVAERLETEWRHIAPVEIGGPAMGTRSGDFVSGHFIKRGFTITSRGCPNKCWFCSVWKREGTTRELPIVDGWDVLDDNLLACSKEHILAVFEMLSRQPHRAKFTGGLEALRMQPWIAESLFALKPEAVWFAYDTPDDWEPLVGAAEMLWNAGFRKGSHSVRCYVLCGYPKDTMWAAEKRMIETAKAGFMPMAMLWRDEKGERDLAWQRFQKAYARPAMTTQLLKEHGVHLTIKP